MDQTPVDIDPIVARLGQMIASAIVDTEILRQRLEVTEKQLAEMVEANQLLSNRLAEITLQDSGLETK